MDGPNGIVFANVGESVIDEDQALGSVAEWHSEIDPSIVVEVCRDNARG